ncbi:MAG: phosphoesterase [Planctomycetota bacterium]
MSNIWFTSDTHFNHENVIKYCSRPFVDLDDMTESIIASWNCRVMPGDTVYHLGDFALSRGSKHASLVDSILSRLNGQKWLIKGNHDRKEVTDNPRWIRVKDYHEIKVDVGEVHKQRVVMSHYRLFVWNQRHRGAYMLNGHSHGNLNHIPWGRSLDVGVDCFDYAPVSFDEVHSLLRRVPIGDCHDHHEPVGK